MKPPLQSHPAHSNALLPLLLKWTLLGVWAGIVSGVASALFLHALDWATSTRGQHPQLLLLLPVAGLLVGLLYSRAGKSVEAGNNLLLERIHTAGDTIPARMAPLVLIGTVVTHLFGGSAGREGTAVQMGGSLANLLAKPLRLSHRAHGLLIMAGISGGFGSVFGTPLAGAIFGMEVLSIGRIGYEGMLPCLIASLVGDATARALRVTHQRYTIEAVPPMDARAWALVLISGALFACAAAAFVELSHAVQRLAKRWIATPWLRPFVGGCVVIALTFLVRSPDYLGLGIPLIRRSFTPDGAGIWVFALKTLFTAVTLGTGFKGGEVTPLFCIGATLGAAIAKATGEPTGLFAALGFVAVFSGAANTPLACIVMGMELFGSELAAPLAAVCVISYLLTGHRGIYAAQRLGSGKLHPAGRPEGTTLRDLHEPSADAIASTPEKTEPR